MWSKMGIALRWSFECTPLRRLMAVLVMSIFFSQIMWGGFSYMFGYYYSKVDVPVEVVSVDVLNSPSPGGKIDLKIVRKKTRDCFGTISSWLVSGTGKYLSLPTQKAGDTDIGEGAILVDRSVPVTVPPGSYVLASFGEYTCGSDKYFVRFPRKEVTISK